MKVKTSELTGAALDLAVAVCENHYDEASSHAPFQWFKKPYCTDWAVSGPIIEREKMHGIGYHGEWYAEKFITRGKSYKGIGPTPLVAAMRCYVTSKLGDEVDVPEELV